MVTCSDHTIGWVSADPVSAVVVTLAQLSRRQAAYAGADCSITPNRNRFGNDYLVSIAIRDALPALQPSSRALCHRQQTASDRLSCRRPQIIITATPQDCCNACAVVAGTRRRSDDQCMHAAELLLLLSSASWRGLHEQACGRASQKQVCREAALASGVTRRCPSYETANYLCADRFVANDLMSSAGCSGFDWSKDITDDASYRRCYLKQTLPPPNNDTRYVAGFLYSAVPALSPAIVAAG